MIRLRNSGLLLVLSLWTQVSLGQVRQPIALSQVGSELIILDGSGVLLRMDIGASKSVPQMIARLPANIIPVSMAAASLSGSIAIFVTQFYDYSPRRRGDLVQYRIDGGYVRQWPLPWLGIAEGIAADTNGHRVFLGSMNSVHEFNLDNGQFQQLPPLKILGGLQFGSLAYDSESKRLFAADMKSSRLFVWNGRIWTQPTDTRLINRARGIAFHNNKLYLADDSKGTVWVCDWSSPSKVWKTVLTRDAISAHTRRRSADPVAVAVEANMMWIGDLQAGKLIKADVTGQILAVY